MRAKFVLRLPPSLSQRLDDMARSFRISTNDLMVEILDKSSEKVLQEIETRRKVDKK